MAKKDEKSVQNKDKASDTSKPKVKSAIPKVKLPKMDKKSGWRGFAIYAILGIILFAFFAATSAPVDRLMQTKPISNVIDDIKSGKIDKIEIDGDKISVDLKDDGVYISRKEENQSFFETLRAANVDVGGVQINVRDRTFYQSWVTIFTTFLEI